MAEIPTFRAWWFFQPTMFVDRGPRCDAFAFCGRDVLRQFAMSLKRLDFDGASVSLVQESECDGFLPGKFSELVS